MIVTAAMTMVRKAESSGEIMSENPERSLPNNSTEAKGEKSSDILKQRIHHLEEIEHLFAALGEGADDQSLRTTLQAMRRHLASLEDLDRNWHYAIFR
jgi:hypothetical protein